MGCRADFQKIVARIMKLDYKIPEKLNLSFSVKHLLSRIFVKDPSKRISIAEIKQHSWYLHRLPYELQEGYKGFERCCAHVNSDCSVDQHAWPSLIRTFSSGEFYVHVPPHCILAHKVVDCAVQRACQRHQKCVHWCLETYLQAQLRSQAVNVAVQHSCA